jgi:hypothetical protein
MKKTLTLLAASTALTAAIGIPAWSAIRAPKDAGSRPVALSVEDGAPATPIILASDDEDEDEEDADDGDDDDEDCEDDDDACDEERAGPEPAGSVAPPRNGLFGDGAPPQAQVN